jgi:hypothetical protein
MPTDATVLGFSNRVVSGQRSKRPRRSTSPGTTYESSRRLCSSPPSWRHFTDAVAMTSLRATTSRTSSPSSMAVVRLWVMSPPRRTTCAHTLALRSASCSATGTSPRRLLASSSRIRPVRSGARCLKVGFVRCPSPEHISCFTRRACPSAFPTEPAGRPALK